jgi:hypothetical protein
MKGVQALRGLSRLKKKQNISLRSNPRAKRSPDRTRGRRTVRLAPLHARVGLPAHSKQIEPVRLVRDAG